MSGFNFTCVRGDNCPIGGTVTLNAAPYPIGPTDVVRFAAKWHYDDPDSSAVFLLSSPGRIAVTDGQNGVISFSILPSDWLLAFPDPIRKSVTLVADVQVANAAGSTVYTLARGTLTVTPDVTHDP